MLTVCVTQLVLAESSKGSKVKKIKLGLDGGKMLKLNMKQQERGGNKIKFPQERDGMMLLSGATAESQLLFVVSMAGGVKLQGGVSLKLVPRWVDTRLDVPLGDGTAELRIMVTKMNYGPDPHASELRIGSRKTGNASWTHRVVADVMLEECRCLPAMDANGLADPYVTLEVGQMLYKSYRVQNTRNPVWESEDCTFVVEESQRDEPASVLRVTVYDHDRATRDDLIGTCEVNIFELASDHALFGRWIEIRKKERTRGFIKLKAQLNREDEPSIFSNLGSLMLELPFRVNFGDIVLFDSSSFTGNAIGLATGSKWDHAGIICQRDDGVLYIAESTGAGVKGYPLDARLRTFAKHKASLGIRRLMVQRSEEMRQALQRFVESVENRPYEKNFLSLVAAISKSNKEENLESIFCSELVVACLKAMNLLDQNELSNNFLPSHLALSEMDEVLVGGARLGRIKKLSRWTFAANEALRKK